MYKNSRKEDATIKTLIPAVYDFTFKAIMLNPDNLDYLKTLINEITKIPMDDLDDMQVLNSEHIVSGKNAKRMQSDIIVSVGSRYINIEANKDYYKGVFTKNKTYTYQIGSKLYNKNEGYAKEKSVIQINFDNFYLFDNKQEIYEFVMMEKTTHEIHKEINYSIYHVCLPYIKDECYDKDVRELSKFERYCLMLIAETTEYTKKLVGDDEVMKKVGKRLEQLSEDENIIGLYDAEEEARKVELTKLENAKEEGIEQKTKEIINNLHLKNYSLEDIASIVSLSIEEVKRLLNTE